MSVNHNKKAHIRPGTIFIREIIIPELISIPINYFSTHPYPLLFLFRVYNQMANLIKLKE